MVRKRTEVICKFEKKKLVINQSLPDFLNFCEIRLNFHVSKDQFLFGFQKLVNLLSEEIKPE